MIDPAQRSLREVIAPWPSEAAARYLAAGYWRGRSIGSELAAVARRYPDATCLVDGEIRFSYRQLLARADGAARRLRDIGLRAEDRIVLQLPNCWEFVVTTIACFRLGAIPLWALPQYGENEISGLVRQAAASAIVVADRAKDFDHQAMAHQIAAGSETLQQVLVAGTDLLPGSIDLRALCTPIGDPEGRGVGPEADEPDPSTTATFLLSGGTTGLPKLVPRTHNDLLYMIGRAAELCRFSPSTTYLAALPLGHGFPNTGPGVLGTLLTGGRVVIGSSPAPEQVLPLIQRERVTATSAVPAVVRRWLDYRLRHPELDLSSLRLLQVGAARLEPDTARRVPVVLGCMLQQVYGMGEGLLCLTRLDDPAEVVENTQGRPISPADEVLIVDESGLPVPPGQPGVLLTRGPYTASGYYGSPELNEQAFAGGWYRTGDIVRRRPDGNLVVVGREKDLINRGGEKIDAAEIEEFALRVDGVRHAAAVAMPDRELGEAVCLFVVPDHARDIALADVHAVMLQAGAARFKLPERLISVPVLPTTALGKVDKKTLRADVSDRLRSERAAPPGPVAACGSSRSG